MSEYKFRGVNDEVTTCECCGRTELKKTVVLGTDEGEVHYGTECAARALRTGKRDVEKMERDTVKRAADVERRAAATAQANEDRAYDSWLLATYGDTRSDMTRRKAWRAAMAS